VDREKRAREKGNREKRAREEGGREKRARVPAHPVYTGKLSGSTGYLSTFTFANYWIRIPA
jgi:hypothetical protein